MDRWRLKSVTRSEEDALLRENIYMCVCVLLQESKISENNIFMYTGDFEI